MTAAEKGHTDVVRLLLSVSAVLAERDVEDQVGCLPFYAPFWCAQFVSWLLTHTVFTLSSEWLHGPVLGSKESPRRSCEAAS